MNKIVMIVLVTGVIAGMLGCTQPMAETPSEDTNSTEIPPFDLEDVSSAGADRPLSEDFTQAIDDWVTGSDFGIIEVAYKDRVFIVTVPDAIREGYENYEIQDIVDALMDLADYSGYDVEQIFWDNGENVDTSLPAVTIDESSDASVDVPLEDDVSVMLSDDTVNLIFIHHSVGEAWLNDGLSAMLNEANIYVADTYYGWSTMGDRTDIVDWPDWFNDAVMPSVYAKLDTETAHNSITPGPGDNTIVMFKSCFPNSDVGNAIDDEQRIYLSLLPYFEAHPDKMFVLVTSPPMQHISHPNKTRELTNWLVASDGFRSNYSGHNLYVFDLYNVLTSPENHHWLVDGLEQHVVGSTASTLYYDSDGDDHPNSIANVKAADEFVPLLLHWYTEFAGE